MTVPRALADFDRQVAKTASDWGTNATEGASQTMTSVAVIVRGLPAVPGRQRSRTGRSPPPSQDGAPVVCASLFSVGLPSLAVRSLWILSSCVVVWSFGEATARLEGIVEQTASVARTQHLGEQSVSDVTKSQTSTFKACSGHLNCAYYISPLRGMP